MIPAALLSAALFLLPAGASAQDDTSATQTIEAEILRIDDGLCGEDGLPCRRVELRGVTPPYDGRTIQSSIGERDMLGPHAGYLQPGDKLLLETETTGDMQTFLVVDQFRRPALLGLFILFVVALIAIGGIAAVRSFVGLLVSIALLFFFMLPRILAGDPPLLVALVGSLVIMAVTFLVSHGWNAKSGSAFAGTAAALLSTTVIAVIFTVWARLLGQTDEHAVFLFDQFPGLATQGLLLAGIIIGTLGSLDDVTISQASAVFELRLANPSMTARQLYRSALRIGRDHIAGAINTLVLAYAGASLPLILLLAANAGDEPVGFLINREAFATEIIRTLVGSFGLLLSIPFTNAVASYFASRMSVSDVRACCGAHAHHH